MVYGLKDINVEYDVGLARRFYLRMAECFGQDEAYIAHRDFSYPEHDGFTLPCDYQDEIFKAMGFNEGTYPPEDGCPYCPYVSTWKCLRRNDFSPRTKIFDIKKVLSWSGYEFNVMDPNRSQFNYVCRNIDSFKSKYYDGNLKWMNYDSAKAVWKKCYQLLAFWPLKEGVKVKED